MCWVGDEVLKLQERGCDDALPDQGTSQMSEIMRMEQYSAMIIEGNPKMT
jgi:hypothetical protein